MARLAKDHARGGSIFTFSPAVVDAFPLVNYSGVGWASRHPCLWFLPGLYPECHDATASLAYHPIEAMSETERSLFDAVVDDLLKDRPLLLFVEESERKGAFNLQRFDYEDYYSPGSAIRRLLPPVRAPGQSGLIPRLPPEGRDPVGLERLSESDGMCSVRRDRPGTFSPRDRRCAQAVWRSRTPRCPGCRPRSDETRSGAGTGSRSPARRIGS